METEVTYLLLNNMKIVMIAKTAISVWADAMLSQHNTFEEAYTEKLRQVWGE